MCTEQLFTCDPLCPSSYLHAHRCTDLLVRLAIVRITIVPSRPKSVFRFGMINSIVQLGPAVRGSTSDPTYTAKPATQPSCVSTTATLHPPSSQPTCDSSSVGPVHADKCLPAWFVDSFATQLFCSPDVTPLGSYCRLTSIHGMQPGVTSLGQVRSQPQVTSAQCLPDSVVFRPPTLPRTSRSISEME